MNSLKLVATIPVNNTLGEGVVWDQMNQCIWWTDILDKKIHNWSFNHGLNTYSTPDLICSFGLCEKADTLIVAFPKGFAYYQPQRQHLEWLCRVEENIPTTRLNDGRVDRQGRFWAGSMDMNERDSLGTLYLLQQGKGLAKRTDITVSNGLCWNAQGNKIYHADSPTRTIMQAEFDPITGNIGSWAEFAKTNKGAYPDGACVDAQDCLWSAQWGSSKVKRYNIEGEEIFSQEIPCKQPSCVTFGGPALSHLFVTSARVGLDENILSSQPTNGDLFIYETPYTGLAEPRCTQI